MFESTIIMAKDQINCLHNTNEYWLGLLQILFYQLMDQLRTKMGNPLEISFWFLHVYIYIMSYYS